jgi:hypothetical protein
MNMARRARRMTLLVCMAVGLMVTTVAVSADTSYTCPNNTCSFTIPGYYSKYSSDDTSIIFKDANTGGTFTVALADLPAIATLDDAVAVVNTQISALPAFQPDPAGVQNETVGGNPARSLVYLYNLDDGTAAEAKVFYTVYGGRLYLLQFATTPDQEDTFVQSAQQVFDSWQFM